MSAKVNFMSTLADAGEWGVVRRDNLLEDRERIAPRLLGALLRFDHQRGHGRRPGSLSLSIYIYIYIYIYMYIYIYVYINISIYIYIFLPPSPPLSLSPSLPLSLSLQLGCPLQIAGSWYKGKPRWFETCSGKTEHESRLGFWAHFCDLIIKETSAI